MRPVLWIDLDDTLITSIMDDDDNIIEIVPRPGVEDFLRKLSRHGDLYLLTYATRPHVRDAFKALGPISKIFKAVVSRESLRPIIEQIEIISKDPDLTADERVILYDEIQPIYEKGFIFDDQRVDSDLYWIKTLAVGAEEDDWIRVKPFRDYATAKSELDRAYAEYRRRAAGGRMMAGARR